ncbi:MAG: hypothetical protein J6Z34_03505, partial [Clostridia bacterium]|nr:hypothetical protein [Clostridia bacterium]
KNIKIENVNIVHAGSMGLIAQLSENISITGLNVRLFEGLSCGLVSTNCDATHFVNCRGLIRINKSVFNNMMDDGVNIHGVYTEAVRTEGNCVWLKIMHFQQYGINFYAENDIIAVHERSTVATRGVYTVAKSELTAPDIIKVTFKELPQIEAGDFVDNVSMHPDVIIENTETGFNRPRGFLLTTNGNVIIRNNVFNSCSYGIHIAGDMTYWFESTGTKNVLIEDNIFRNNCVQFGDYSIAITPEYEETTKEEYFHENIKIRNNKFYSFVPGAVYAKGVDGLEITGNLLEKSYDYYRKSSAPAVETINCRNVIIDKNIF